MGSFIIVAGWNWYHLSHRPHGRFIVISLVMWAVVFLFFHLGKLGYIYLAKRTHRHFFWYTEFKNFLDKLFFFFSLFFIIFFFKNELWSLFYVSALFLFLFNRLHSQISLHPDAHHWLLVNKSVFILGYFIFLLSSLAQYLAYHYYILDSNARFYNIVIFRSFSITMFWLFGFAIAGFIFLRLKIWWRYIVLGLWIFLFFGFMFFWAVNTGVLVFSSLYLSPFMFTQVEGASNLFLGENNLIILGFLVIFIAIFVFVLRQVVRAIQNTPRRYWYFYNFVIAFIAILSFFSIASFRNTPEYLVARSFYKYFRGETEMVTLSPTTQKKLEQFGLFYNLGKFNIARRDQVYVENEKKLPEKFSQQSPNIIIVFLESFSARLTGPYNEKYREVTPGLNDFSNNTNTTIFKNFYNASTPTITGLISDLCSILPPTGHNEIQEEKRLQNHHLLCLPEILKKHGKYEQIRYITAVDKNFSNKNSIFKSMGVDDVWGLEELKKNLGTEPLSWGYSDHQMFPMMWSSIEKESVRPFLYMLSTVDTHPPFNISQDMEKYKEGESDLLNAVHSTDDAFGQFWQDFKNSPRYDDTMVIAIADHAVFPTAYDRKNFPEEYGQYNFYDELFFGLYIPDNILPEKVEVYSSSIDFTPTILQILGINIPNSFEGHSIFADREKYPNILGMHEFGLYINQISKTKTQNSELFSRDIQYDIPSNLNCDEEVVNENENKLSLCEFLEYYRWKRQMFEEGRFWKE